MATADGRILGEINRLVGWQEFLHLAVSTQNAGVQ
jgi:hypothetical protein